MYLKIVTQKKTSFSANCLFKTNESTNRQPILQRWIRRWIRIENDIDTDTKPLWMESFKIK